MNAAGLAVKTEKPVMKQSAGKIWEKIARNHICAAPGRRRRISFFKSNGRILGFISVTDIKDIYLPMGFSNFKIEGRGLGKCTDFGISAVLYD